MYNAGSRRIAVVAPSSPPWGGGGVSAAHYQLYRFFLDAGIDAELLTFNEIGDHVSETGIHRFGASGRLRKVLDFGVYLYLKAVGSRRPAYQVVDIINSVPGVLGVNRVLRRMKPDVLIMPDHGAPGLFLDAGDARVFMVAHHNPSRFVNNPLLGCFCPIDAARAVQLEQRALQRVEAVICPSEYMRSQFKRTYSFSGVVSVIPNPIDEIYIEAIPVRDTRNELGLPQNVPVLYIPSAGSILKGSRFVSEIARRLGKAYGGILAFYLSGHIPVDLQAELATLPDNIRLFMPGQINHDLNIAYVKSCTFGISPTLVENFSMAMLEAGFCNVPMVTFDVGGNPELIEEGQTGFLVPYPEIDALVAASAKLLDDSFCTAIRQTTGAYVRKKFDFKSIGRQYLDLCGIEHD